MAIVTVTIRVVAADLGPRDLHSLAEQGLWHGSALEGRLVVGEHAMGNFLSPHFWSTVEAVTCALLCKCYFGLCCSAQCC